LYERALQGREASLGATHPDTLTSVNNLAAVLKSQGKYAAAKDLYERALQGREASLGATHPNTLNSVNRLSQTLVQLSRLPEALELCRMYAAHSNEAEASLGEALARCECLSGNKVVAKELITTYLQQHPKEKSTILHDEGFAAIRDFIEGL